MFRQWITASAVFLYAIIKSMKALSHALGIVLTPFLFVVIMVYTIIIVVEIEIKDYLSSKKKKKMPDPEEVSWTMAGDNPAINVEEQMELPLTKEEETQPYRRPTYLDEIQGWSD
jgi:hypothetical protein